MAPGPVLSAVVRRLRARTTAEQKLPLPQGKGHRLVFQRDCAVGAVDLPAFFPITPRGRLVSAGLFLENTPEEGGSRLQSKRYRCPGPTAESLEAGTASSRGARGQHGLRSVCSVTRRLGSVSGGAELPGRGDRVDYCAPSRRPVWELGRGARRGRLCPTAAPFEAAGLTAEQVPWEQIKVCCWGFG